MRRAGGTLANAFLTSAMLAIVACIALPSTEAQAQIFWKPCGDSNEVACGHLTVGLDPAGITPGVITLALRRHRAPVGESEDAVIALAGGPGQAALPFLSNFGELLGPIASTRDVITFDQRGTGLSHPLSCAAFEHLTGAISPNAVSVCAKQIGATRGLYTTADTVADIEAIRQAGGYKKLVLYGTSYGTKVAERYAQEYPSHVEALILDSVVPPTGPEPFDETSFAAISRILRQLCAARTCAHTTPEPVRDLARLVNRMSRSPLRGRTIDDKGVSHTTRIYSNELVGILFEGDLDPLLRAEFPAAVRSAVEGYTAELARLLRRAEGEPEGEQEDLNEGFDWPLYYSTICDEAAFPWKQSASPRTRLQEALAALRAQPARAFAPFTYANALALSDVPACAAWPSAPSDPEVDEAPLPNVPTLILSGEDDLRTPTANARLVAAQIPDANLLVVPNTGHSVLGSDPTSCSSNALRALFAGKPVRPCIHRPPSPLLLPVQLPPRNLSDVPRPPHSHGRAGRTLAAAVLTLGDFNRQLLLATLEHVEAEGLSISSSVRTGGLLAGWGETTDGSQVLRGYSYVPGVSVSGRIKSGIATLRVSGASAAHGTIRISARGTITGRLANQHVHLTASQAIQIQRRGSTLAFRSPLSKLTSDSTRLALRGKSATALLRYLLGASSQ